jgi:hypothetical protein
MKDRWVIKTFAFLHDPLCEESEIGSKNSKTLSQKGGQPVNTPDGPGFFPAFIAVLKKVG